MVTIRLINATLHGTGLLTILAAVLLIWSVAKIGMLTEDRITAAFAKERTLAVQHELLPGEPLNVSTRVPVGNATLRYIITRMNGDILYVDDDYVSEQHTIKSIPMPVLSPGKYKLFVQTEQDGKTTTAAALFTVS